MLVGTETVIKDNPSLMPRPADRHKPLRIIPDRTGRIPLSRKVFTDGFPTLGIIGPEVSDARKTSLQNQGIDVLQLKSFSWSAIMKALGKRGVQHILCEGGGQLAGALLKADLIQEIEWVVAPKILGEKGRPAIGGGWTLDKAPGFEIISQERRGQDLWMLFQKDRIL
jgi:diaminohydroxyphosphoribosylaminopyrimidine deaminase/5-amino-6-(5-phosphoribosylamino)uracil reductase